MAVNESGTFYGGDQSFTTLPPPPAVTTSAPTFVMSTGATLNGTVNPNGGPTTAYFEYGTTTSYGSQTATQNLGSGTTAVALTGTPAGLQPFTTYHYRIVATNNNGTTRGADGTSLPRRAHR